MGLLTCACLLAGPASDAVAATGGISGTVTDATTHAPLSGVCVTAYASSGNPSFATTDSSGAYAISGLANGSYKVDFQTSGQCTSGSGVARNYLDQYYNGEPAPAEADAVSVTGATATGIDAAMHAGGQISGTVTDAGTHAAIAGECVIVYDSSGNPVTFATSDASGSYTVSTLASGIYRVGFGAGHLSGFCPPGGANYAEQFYGGGSSLSTADAVPVTAGFTATSVDGALQPGTGISGTVTDASTHAAVAGECVIVYDSGGNGVGFGSTDASGRYTITDLTAGSYKVRFGCGERNYSEQFYSGKSSLAAADAVSVIAGATTTGIDAALQPGGGIGGVVTDANTHTAITGACVTAYDSAGNDVGDAFDGRERPIRHLGARHRQLQGRLHGWGRRLRHGQLPGAVL